MAASCFTLEVGPAGAAQAGADLSFIGGYPRLPASMPLPGCTVCGAPQSFFLQVALPEDHLWEGFSLAVFASTECLHRDLTIPEMLPVPVRGRDIPAGFLDAYQRNFRLAVFPTGDAAPRSDYVERVAFRPLRLAPAAKPRVKRNKIGGAPNWLLEDESPGRYAGTTDMFFLMQILPGLQFDLLPGAPRQVNDWEGDPPGRSIRPYYTLFNGNALYFFGTADREHPLVYVITQVD